MKTFMSITDLDNLPEDDPAKPVVRQLLEWLIAPGEFPDPPSPRCPAVEGLGGEVGGGVEKRSNAQY